VKWVFIGTISPARRVSVPISVVNLNSLLKIRTVEVTVIDNSPQISLKDHRSRSRLNEVDVIDANRV
jgi:hypothetical protein